MALQWIVADQPDKDKVNVLIDQLKVPRLIASVLINRGIETLGEARNFFRPDWNDLYDPFLICDMAEAVDRIEKALETGERIFIYGDYDVDGITATSMLTLFFQQLGAPVSFFIPNRMREGYGLSSHGIQQASQMGAKLLISVDCGITGIEEVKQARALGIDTIISDHHEPGKGMPDAVAILDPKRKDCAYPFKELAGVGVAFKLIQGISRRLNLDEETYRQYVDLVALGSTADIVPLIDENRVLVQKGLERINQLDRVGIRALVESSGLTHKIIGTGQVVFVLAPRINAVGRLGNAERAVKLLITESVQQSKNIASVLEIENQNRKDIDEETFLDALSLVKSECDLEKERAVVLAKDGWHSGVIGIVASRVVEQVYRPTIMIAIENGIGKGSARSIPNFDIYSALKACGEHLLGFGGHRYAAGMTIEPGKIDAFREAFQKVAQETVSDEALIQKVYIDAEISLSEITEKVVRILNRFAPFGPQNMRPVFLSRQLDVVGTPRIVGKNHLKFKVRQNGQVFDAIGFDLGDLLYRLTPGESNLDMVYVIEENHYMNTTRVQLRVKDLR